LETLGDGLLFPPNTFLEHLREYPKSLPNPIFSKIGKTPLQQRLIHPANLLAFGKKTHPIRVKLEHF